MVKYRLATPDDNQQLIALTAGSGMEGEISLRIDRQPDFFKLLRLRGESKVFVAVNDDTIIGCLCVSSQQVYIGGEIFPLQYIGDFKVAPAFRNKGIGLQLCNEMADYVTGVGADLAFLNVSSGNRKPISFFSNRPNIPDFENIGLFTIRQFIGKKKRVAHPLYLIEPHPVTLELIEFLNRHSRKYELGNVITADVLEGSDVFVVKRGTHIIASMCLADTMGFKQNVVTGLSRKLKYLLESINAMYRISGISRMPTINKPVKMIYVKYLAVDNDEEILARLLISHARNIVYDKGYSFLSIGLHQKDPMNRFFSGMIKLTFRSVGMLVSIKNNQWLIEKVKEGVPFEDYSLV